MDTASKNEGYKTFIDIMEPARIRGIAYIILSNMEGVNTIWRYVPGPMGKRRVPDAKVPFMESQFLYEDLADQEARKYTYFYLREGSCGADTCSVLERFPKKDSAYTKQTVWVDKEYRLRMAQAFNDRGLVVKSFIIRDYEKRQGQYWWPKVVEVKSTKDGAMSRLTYSGYKVDAGITPATFNPGRMEVNRKNQN